MTIDKTDRAVARSSLRAVCVESAKTIAASLLYFCFVLIYNFFRFKNGNNLDYSFVDFPQMFVSCLERCIADTDADKDDQVYDT